MNSFTIRKTGWNGEETEKKGLQIMDIYQGRHKRDEVCREVTLLGHFTFPTHREMGIYSIPLNLVADSAEIRVPIPAACETTVMIEDYIVAGAVGTVVLEDFVAKRYKIFIEAKQEYAAHYLLQQILEGKLLPVISFEKKQIAAEGR